MISRCAALLLLLPCLALCQEARLLVSKQVVNNLLAEGKDATVLYTLYNVGDTAALQVELGDASFSEEYFTLTSGSLTASWARVAPGANVTHAAIVRPLVAGQHNFTSAQVSYLASEAAEQRMVGYSTAPGQGVVMPAKMYERQHSSHGLDWMAFSAMTLPSLLFPFLLYHSSASQYQDAKPKKL